MAQTARCGEKFEKASEYCRTRKGSASAAAKSRVDASSEQIREILRQATAAAVQARHRRVGARKAEHPIHRSHEAEPERVGDEQEVARGT